MFVRRSVLTIYRFTIYHLGIYHVPFIFGCTGLVIRFVQLVFYFFYGRHGSLNLSRIKFFATHIQKYRAAD